MGWLVGQWRTGSVRLGVEWLAVLPEELGQAKAQGEGGGKDQPGIGHQAVVVEGDLDAVGVVTW